MIMEKKCPYCGFTTDLNITECERCGALLEDIPGEPETAENEEWFDDFDEPSPDAYQNRPRRGKRYTASEGTTIVIIAIVGFCTGIFCVGMILDVIAMILGFRRYNEDHSRKRCLAGAIIGAVGIVLSILIFIISANTDISTNTDININITNEQTQEQQ